MATYNKFQDFAEQVYKGVHVFGTHTLKVALTNSAPVATNTILANITQISAGNGYTTGGEAVANVTATESSGTLTVAGDEVTWTASGGTVGPFKYVVLYNDTATNDPLIAWWEYPGSALTLQAGETFKWKPSNSASGGTIFTHA